jgi:hypothetical protein
MPSLNCDQESVVIGRRDTAMTIKENTSSASSEDRQTKRESAFHLAEATAALPPIAADKDLVWRHWRATWLGGNRSLRS